ncbi:hypothetical protein [Salipiger abyssi]|uniref:hypothetical protein n=1 Tax=Salipiger abyssi TaxID=1250539 RepID=UPI001A9082DC|nr:hypothetical protein [Salipiger abyssi]MBN9889153.1 hypothetical protein [Salipiger abyssi]
MLVFIYGIAVCLGAIAGAVSAGVLMILAALLAKATRVSIPFSSIAALALLWQVWQRVTFPIRQGLATGEVDGPGGIGAVALLFGMHAFLATGAISVLGLSIRLWIEARKRDASKLETAK